MQPTVTNLETLQSQVIDLLRFPLIVGVVLVHVSFSETIIPGVKIDESSFPIYYICSQLFSDVLGRVPVPLFFIISGLLFFRNMDFNKQNYVKKLHNRVHTLMVPYLFWNITALMFLLLIHRTPALDAFLIEDIEISPLYIVQSLWGRVMEDGMAAAPISGQFWFVRDLMLLVILTPIVYTFIKKLGRYLVAFLGLLWMFDCWFVYPYPCVRAVFFFTLGAWFGINKRNLVVEAEKVKYYAFVLYPILVIADLLTKGGEANLFIHRVGVLCGIPFWLNVGLSSMRTMVIATAKYEAVKAASVLGFSHINKSFWTALRSKGSWIANIKKDAIERYLLGRITIVLIGLGSYYVLRKISPSFTNFITGGR